MKQKKSFHWTRVVLAAVIVFFYIPIVYTVLFSFNASRSLTTFSGFSLRWYEKMFSSSVTMGAIGTTFAIAILATIISTCIGTITVIGLSRCSKPLRRAVRTANDLPIMNPDIVTAIGTATNVTAYIPADAYATKEDYETYKAIALGAQATAEEALALARQAIAIAQAAEASANDLSNAVGQNTSKIATLWDAVFSDITSNPFQITFADLTGITLKSGVWNASLQRLEC